MKPLFVRLTELGTLVRRMLDVVIYQRDGDNHDGEILNPNDAR